MTSGPDHVDRIQAEWRRERPDIDASPQGVFGRLFRLTAALSAQIVAVYESHGLTEGEFDVLCALRRAGAPYERQPAELARTTMITTGGLTKRLDRLEAAGLVERAPATSGDGRAKTARLTAAGLSVIDAAFTDHMANEVRLIALLEPEDRAALEKALRNWSAVLDGNS
ncbi:MarR family winged helix-turn-helix transcriptional regulator [Austwickia chelonae]|uniref:MarR family winged helix-turn-helix transcriptional regulator n=1 Tax=Austwickia chelonae TaxID=100225 RepID=UPI000E23549C|nr:MarR family transcriptional regulator [Austwickia chelonae]